MFNPFNPFQAAATSFTDAAKQAAQTADNAGKPSTPHAIPGMTSGPFGPAFGQAAQEKLQSGMHEMQQQLQTMFDPQKLFGGLFTMQGLKDLFSKDLFPKNLTQAMNSYMGAFAPSSMSELTQQFTSQTQQAMQAVQQAATQTLQQGAAQSQTGQTAFSGANLAGLVATQQKNMETLGRAQQAAVSSWQQIAKRQAEIFHETLQTVAGAMHELMATGAPEDKLARQADLAAQAFETTSRHIEELTKLVTDGNHEALRVVTARVQESLQELKQTATQMAGKTPAMQPGAPLQTAMDAMAKTMTAATGAFTRTATQATNQAATAAEQTAHAVNKSASDAV